jgi:DNA-nicking Smr family endonuclease
MTGKGIHSKGNRSILKPTVKEWCRERGFEYDEEEDHLKVYVVLER